MSEINLTPLKDLLECGDATDCCELTKQFILNAVVVDSAGAWYVRTVSYDVNDIT